MCHHSVMSTNPSGEVERILESTKRYFQLFASKQKLSHVSCRKVYREDYGPIQGFEWDPKIRGVHQNGKEGIRIYLIIGGTVIKENKLQFAFTVTINCVGPIFFGEACLSDIRVE